MGAFESEHAGSMRPPTRRWEPEEMVAEAMQTTRQLENERAELERAYQEQTEAYKLRARRLEDMITAGHSVMEKLSGYNEDVPQAKAMPSPDRY